MNDDILLDEARRRALEVLWRCATPRGFRASGLAAGYPQIWARDNGVIFLGAIASGEPQLIDTCRHLDRVDNAAQQLIARTIP